ncbi:MAG: hypothetical protein CM15mP74_09570 [Halieaceae bacterium]|nr:MAG: hypothetical protein CM15mP74_09570 [Halieaceae bacterium]
MTRDDMDSVLAEHVAAVHRAQAAGFDMIEMHAPTAICCLLSSRRAQSS